MAEANSMETLNGFHKTIYGDELTDLVPEGVKLSKMIPFVKPNKKMGLDYRQPVNLQLEHGVSYLGSEGLNTQLNAAIAGATREASVKGCEMVLRGSLSFTAISRSINDAASYGRATKHVIKNLLISTYKKQEQMCFYGQSGIGQVESVSGTDIVIKAASFAPGIYAGGEGMKVSFYTALSGGFPHDDGVTISNVNIKTRTLTLSAAVSVAADDFIFEFGARGNESLGIESMLSETSANVFGIPTSDYSLWKGNVYDLYADGGESAGGAPLSFDHVSKSIADAVSKGLEGKLDLFVNPKTWSDLLSEQTALRQFDSRYDTKKYENGAMSIVFYSQNGMIEVHSSTYVKEGIAFGLDLSCFERVGSSDVTFKVPGSNDDFVIKLEGQHALEYRTYADVAVFCNAIGHNILITSISNS